MLRGLSFPFFLGMCTRLSGFERYPLFESVRTASYFSFGLFHVVLSTPEVLLPLFLSDTLLTASALA